MLTVGVSVFTQGLRRSRIAVIELLGGTIRGIELRESFLGPANDV